MKLVIGLGNPGQEYANTRHNAGWLALDALASDLNTSWSEDKKHKAEIAKATLGTENLLLVKPQTYMNNSGDAVLALMSYYKVKPEDILIIQDEMDLAPGAFKFTLIGGKGGHNGIGSIFQVLGIDKIPRLRLGIGRPEKPIPSEDYVLQKMDDATAITCKKMIDPMKDWITNGLERAMNIWNKTIS